MQIKTFFLATALIFSAAANAQTNIPADYSKGSITLADGSVVTGYIKDNLKKSASVSFIDNSGSNKKSYDASQINGIKIETAEYSCIKGDFFKSLSAGKLNFLQKASNSAGKISMNGSQPVYYSGTEGKVGDYFVYADNNLTLINKKSVEAFINTNLTGCTAAVEKAKTINGDIAKLQEAVDIFNKSK